MKFSIYNQYQYIMEEFDRLFIRRKAKKPTKFYQTFIHLYDLYPNIGYEYLKDIPKKGYYGDYIYILIELYNMITKNGELLEYNIYDIIIKTLKQDIINYNNNNKITTLSKWLPNENLNKNKKYKIVKKIVEKLYPDDNDIIRYKKYRLLRTKLNDEIGFIRSNEVNINFNKINNKQIKNKIMYIKKHHNETYKKYIIDKITNFNRLDIMKNIINKKYNDYEIEIINEEYYKKDMEYDKYFENINTIYVDLSDNIFLDEYHYIIIDIMIKHNKRYYIYNGKEITLDGNINNKIKQIYMRCHKNINIENDEFILDKNMIDRIHTYDIYRKNKYYNMNIKYIIIIIMIYFFMKYIYIING
jgi:hypothetical protein